MGAINWLFAAKGLRTFCYGFLSVLFPVYLSQLGFEPQGVGLAVAVTILGSALITAWVQRPARRWGLRPVYLTLCVSSSASALIFWFFENPWLAVLAALLAALPVGEGESGPFLALDQAALSRSVSQEKLSGAFSLYHFTGYVMAALGAAALGFIGENLGVFFLVFLACALVQAGLFIFGVFPAVSPDAVQEGPSSPSVALIRRLSALFALDSFAGGFVALSLVLYWFHFRFNLEVSALGWIAFAAQLAAGISFLAAPVLAKRLGLVNTIVFTHLVSNVLLIAVAFAPTAAIAVGLLLARYLLSQVDVPTRQTFLMSAVEDHEREKAAAMTTMARTAAKIPAPALTGWVMQAAVSAPFILGGGLKIIYDLLLYAAIRKVKLKQSG